MNQIGWSSSDHYLLKVRFYPLIFYLINNKILSSVGFVTNIYGLILTIESVYDHIQALTDDLTERIIDVTDSNERELLKTEKCRLATLKPMSAKNYFDVNRSTITSMLSVR